MRRRSMFFMCLAMAFPLIAGEAWYFLPNYGQDVCGVETPQEVNWQYRTRRLSGAWGDWVSMNTSSHILYTVDSTPAASTLYDLGLDKACRYANGASDFASAINQGIATDICYDPRFEVIGHGLHIYLKQKGQCCCHADVFSVLISHITSTIPTCLYYWWGCDSSTICYYRYVKGIKIYLCSFQCDRRAEDYAEANPHFTFHVQALYNNVLYDPSYGMTGMATFKEMTPVTANHSKMPRFQFHLNLPIYEHTVDWVCPH